MEDSKHGSTGNSSREENHSDTMGLPANKTVDTVAGRLCVDRRRESMEDGRRLGAVGQEIRQRAQGRRMGENLRKPVKTLNMGRTRGRVESPHTQVHPTRHSWGTSQGKRPTACRSQGEDPDTSS